MDNSKPWYQSTAIWGSLGSVLVTIAAVVGHQLDPAAVSEGVTSLSQIVTALFSIWALRGRLVATKAIS